jgi:hypothetical protein
MDNINNKNSLNHIINININIILMIIQDTISVDEYDIIIGVYSCDTIPKYKEQILKIEQTYGKLIDEHKNVKILYFLGEDIVLSGNKYIHLKNVKNDYLSASYKQFLGMKYIYENYKTKFVMMIGTDTYINIKKLLKFIKDYDHTDNLYIGGHGDTRIIGPHSVYYHSGGPGFILTQKCLGLIYPKLEHFMNEWIDVCNKYNRGDLITACDVGISYLTNKYNTNLIRIDGLIFIHCNYKGIPCHNGQVETKNIISCHLMSLNDFDNFTNILINNNYFV